MSSSERVRGLLCATLAAGVALAAAAVGAGAQGAVRGELSLVQRDDAPDADLGDAVVWLVPRDASPPRPAAGEATIVMRHREFAPHVATVAVGGAVAFPNDDPFSHNVFSNVDLGPFDLGLYRRGATRAATFPRAGVYPIYCNIHSKMVSFVVAVPTPWVARADAAGRFAIAGVPAGRYVLHAWHERAGDGLARDVVVPAVGLDDVRLALDARRWVAAPHLNKLGRPYAAMRADRY